MVKITQNQFIIGILTVFIILSLSLIATETTMFNTVGESGYNVLSIDEPNLASGDDLKDLNWLVFVTLGGSERVEFTIDESEFEGESGVSPENPFTVEVFNIKETLNYNIEMMSEDLAYGYNVDVFKEDGSIDNIDSYCPNAVGVYTKSGGLLQKDILVCLNRNIAARYGTLSNPATFFSSEIMVGNGEERFGPELLSNEIESVNLKNSRGETIVHASWEGNLMTGAREPSVPEYAVLGSTEDSWHFISENKFTDYESAEQNFLNDWFSYDTSQMSYSDVELMAGTLQQKASMLDSERESTIFSPENLGDDFNIENPTSENNVKLEYETVTSLQTPTVTFDIRADWLGLKSIVGEPKILSANSDKFGKDDYGSVKFEVTNRGSDGATFFADLKNCQNFDDSDELGDFPVDNGEIVAKEIRVDVGSLDSEITETCEVCIADTQNPSNEDCAFVTLDFDPSTRCIEGTYRKDLDNNQIVECVDGTKLVTVEECGPKETPQFTGEGPYDGYQCKEEPTPPEPSQKFNIWVFAISLVVGGLVAMIIGVYMRIHTKNGWILFLVGMASFIGATVLTGLLVQSIIQSIGSISFVQFATNMLW